MLLRNQDGSTVEATWTTDHPSSSYGRKVLVLEDGTALGPADLLVNGLVIIDAGIRDMNELHAAGYPVQVP